MQRLDRRAFDESRARSARPARARAAAAAPGAPVRSSAVMRPRKPTRRRPMPWWGYGHCECFLVAPSREPASRESIATIVWRMAHGRQRWAWKKMRPLMRAPAISSVRRPTRGWASARISPAPRSTSRPISRTSWRCSTPRTCSDVTLIGHSYGGMVATGVADRAPTASPARLSRRVRAEGRQSLFDLVRRTPRPRCARARRRTRRLAPAAQSHAARTAPEDPAWAVPRRRPQPIKTFEQKISLQSKDIPAASLHLCKKERPGRRVPPVRRHAESEAGWTSDEIDASHDPHITLPDVLMELLTEIMASK